MNFRLNRRQAIAAAALAFGAGVRAQGDTALRLVVIRRRVATRMALQYVGDAFAMQQLWIHSLEIACIDASQYTGRLPSPRPERCQ